MISVAIAVTDIRLSYNFSYTFTKFKNDLSSESSLRVKEVYGSKVENLDKSNIFRYKCLS